MFGSTNISAGKGRPKANNDCNQPILRQGHSRGSTLARLDRDRPDLAARKLMTSVRGFSRAGRDTKNGGNTPVSPAARVILADARISRRRPREREGRGGSRFAANLGTVRPRERDAEGRFTKGDRSTFGADKPCG